MSERKCSNWLESFRSFSMPRTESPKGYVDWTGLFVLAAALRRRVYIPANGVLGGWECTPHMYVMLVGPPGFRKTTAMEAFGIPLLEQVSPILSKGPTFVTKEALVQQLVNSEDKSMYMTITEFGDIMQKNGPEMYDFFTSMFDGKKSIESRTISRQIEFALRPCINMLAATTPEWIAYNMPAAAIGGGFASRVIFVNETKLSRKQMYYRFSKEQIEKLEAIEKDLVTDLSHISNNLQGAFTLTPEAFEYMENWYQKVHPEVAPHPKLAGYWQRKPTHIHKLAMLFSVAEKDELVLTKGNFDSAINAITATEKNLKKVFEGVGANKHTFSMSDIVSFVIERGKVSKAEVVREFQSAADPNKLEELFEGCIKAGFFDCIQGKKQDGDGLTLYFTKPTGV